MVMAKDFVVIECVGELLLITQYRGTKVVMKHTLDLIETDQRTLFNALMKHNQDIPLVITWKDLRFLRQIGLRV